MKTLLFCFFLSICRLTEATGQRQLPVDTNKYKIKLPEYWKPGNRVWKILSDKLPLVCDELKDKLLCGDGCNPAYTLSLEISDPVIYDYFSNHVSSDYTNNLNGRPTDTWEIQTLYGFECSLLLRNDKGTLITRFILVDTDETWKINNRIVLPSFSSPPVAASLNKRIRTRGYSSDLSPAQNQPAIQVPGHEGETPYSYINKNQEKLAPKYRDMLAIIDRKINSW